MDANNSEVRPNPREKANFLSVLLWTWTCNFFWTGYSRDFGPDDLFEPLKSDKSDCLGDRLERKWLSEIERCRKSADQPSFLKAIVKCFFLEIFLYGLLHAANEFILRLATPWLLGELLKYFRGNGNVSETEAFLYAGGISSTIAINVLLTSHLWFSAYRLGSKIRIAVRSLVYRKVLRLDVTAFGETPPGKIVNFVANDVNKFNFALIYIYFICSSPIIASIIVYYLYTQAGYAGLFGLIVILLVFLLQFYTSKLSMKYLLKCAIKTDERIRKINEIISGIQVIKMYAWEKPFFEMTSRARELELKIFRKINWIRGIFMALNLFTARMAIYCTFIGMLLYGANLTIEMAFVFVICFNNLAFTMSSMLARGIAEVRDYFVTLKRIQNLLLQDEFAIGDRSIKTSSSELTLIYTNKAFINDELYFENLNHMMIEDKNYVIEVSNATGKWDAHQPECTLKNINFKLERGKLYEVIGAVGSGKSSLLLAILGELSLIKGQINIDGTVSYASQDAWVFGSTVRQNILFGQPYEQQRYHNVVEVCALLNDFKQFTKGDLTVVGERGISLSGGQKARINLARCIYRKADIYILDDPLSAVDAHVGKHLFEECIQRYLNGKTRILATHQLQFIKDVNSILLMNKGRVRIFSSYLDLGSEVPEYSFLLTNAGDNETDDEDKPRKEIPNESNDLLKEDNVINNLEKTSANVVKGSILVKYFTIGNSWLAISAMVLLFILTQTIVSSNDYFIMKLVNEESTCIRELLNSRNHSESYLNSELFEAEADDCVIKSNDNVVYIYTGIVLSIFIVGIIRIFLFVHVCYRSSKLLHKKSFSSLLKTPMRFFDTNSSGRILNRFSNDMGVIDEILPRALLDAVQTILLIIGTVIVVCIVDPIFLIPLLIILSIFYWIRKVYLKSSQSMRRLEGIMIPPVFTHLNETLNGLTTIRAHNAEKILKFEFDRYQDAHTSSWYLSTITLSAYGFFVDALCLIFSTIVTFMFLITNDGVSESKIGLAISNILMQIGRIQWGISQDAAVVNHLSSVERVLEYTLLPSEKDSSDFLNSKKRKGIAGSINKSNPPEHWPTEGRISFQNVYLRYSDDSEPVLNNLNLMINAKEKVGIVGRTGAGKSSFITALFRLPNVDGIIEIDGVDTKTIHLEDLRKNISIIPQNPFLFSGSLRSNLDPFGEFDDKSLWNVLEEVELKEYVGDNGLDLKVFDQGNNFSVGQRQLLCLARAILKNNKILVLDEATANVDPHTDSLIQKTIRNKFAKCTVLTVAHRLNTIMDSDRILVMDTGKVVEFDHPYVLLKDNQGVFTSLVQQTGQSMTEQLTSIAKKSY